MGAMIQISEVTDELDKLIGQLEELGNWGCVVKSEQVHRVLKDIRDRLYIRAYPDHPKLDKEVKK